MKEEILQKIAEADMVLVGIGEEFEDNRVLKNIEQYRSLREQQEKDCAWMIPATNRCLLKQSDSKVYLALNRLAKLLEGKNYFVVSITTNEVTADSMIRQDRVVMPCGGSRNLQCVNGCEGGILENPKFDEALIWEPVGKCPVCGERLIYNNIYSEKYDENGYLPRWNLYTKWLQGTLFRKICILELGVGMQCPSVIRFPFEKVGYFNQKADFVRVNEHLYQMTSELGERGISVAMNAIDWLLEE